MAAVAGSSRRPRNVAPVDGAGRRLPPPPAIRRDDAERPRPICRPRRSRAASSSTRSRFAARFVRSKSIVLSSPMQSGELQILKLAKSGTMVKPGDLLVQFDPSTLRADDSGEAVGAEAGGRGN